MRLNLQNIIHVPGASLPFEFSMDLSKEEFFGNHPVTRPVQVEGRVRNIAGMLVLEGEAATLLDCICDRCMEPFQKEKAVRLYALPAESLEGEEDEDMVLLEDGELDVGSLAYTAFVLDMDTKYLCSEDCKGLCPGCGVNLNREACRCRKPVDPRWAALEQLLDKPE